MHLLAEYGIFLAEVLTIVVAIIILVAAILGIATKSKHKGKAGLVITKLNDKYKEQAEILHKETLSKQAYKKLVKEEKKAKKATEKQAKTKPIQRKKIFVLDFHGDIRASAVNHMREEITALLTVVKPEDEVVVRVESGGGMVHSYGLAASQLKRFRQHHIPLTITIDKVAASGGYMMAAVGNKILAAPFAIVGSIGVIAQLPNFHRLLKKKDIDFDQIIAGDYKRTLTVFGENTKKARAKFQEDIDDTHNLFKEFVLDNRPQVKIDEVATGEHWFGKRATDLNLVDDLMTSDDYLLNASQEADVYTVSYHIKKGLVAKLLGSSQQAFDKLMGLVSSNASYH